MPEANKQEDSRERQRPEMFRDGTFVSGRFSIQAHIGNGGFSHVYRAVDTLTMEPVAIKAVHANLKRIAIRERRVLKILQRHEHPNIIRLLLDTRAQDPRGDTAYILCYPLMQHSLMDEVLTHKKARGGVGGLDAAMIEPALRDIVTGMAFLEEQHVVHLDLKPENILRTRGSPNRLVLADFGNATPNIAHDVKFEAQTAWYRAPEVCLPANYGFEVDLWSLGCIAYEMECGRVLFKVETSAKLTYLHYRDLGPPPSEFMDMVQGGGPAPYLVRNPVSHQVYRTVGLWTRMPRSPRPRLSAPRGYRTTPLLQAVLRWMPQQRITARELVMWPNLCYPDFDNGTPPPPVPLANAKAVQEGADGK